MVIEAVKKKKNLPQNCNKNEIILLDKILLFSPRYPKPFQSKCVLEKSSDEEDCSCKAKMKAKVEALALANYIMVQNPILFRNKMFLL